MARLASILGVINFLLPPACCVAQQGAPRPVAVSVIPAGTERHVQGRWATLAVNGSNPTDADVEETIVVSVGESPNLQFARRLWLPAHSRRRVWLPVLIPEQLESLQQHVFITFMRINDRQGVEQFQPTAIGLPTTERGMLISWEDSHAAVLLDSMHADQNDFSELYDLYHSLSDLRDKSITSEQDLGVASLTDHFLPTSPTGLDATDQILIAGDRILSDSTSVRQLRAWLRSGGRMWVMLDRMSHSSVERLLGDSMCYSLVDTVELNDFKLREVAAHETASKITDESWSSDIPVKFVRVLTDVDDVDCRIGDWPVAFWKDVGQGEILFTTLGSSGWFDNGGSLRAFSNLAERFFVQRLRPPNNTAHLANTLQHEIGYQIPRRTGIAAALGVHVFVVLGAAVWLVRRQRLDLMAIIIPMSAVLVAGILVAMGKHHTRAAPSTIATGQIARVSAENSEITVNSVAAIYAQQGRPMPIDSSPDSTTMLSQVDLRGELRRILWTDDGRSHWMFVDQPPGAVRHVESESTIPLSHDWIVKGRFTELGFEGDLSGLAAEKCQDPIIIAAAAPALSARLSETPTKSFRAGFDDLLAVDQYIDDALMSDQQRYRQDMLRQLITPERQSFGRQPVLLAWTDTIDSGVSFDDNYQRRGWALVSIPIQLQRVPANSDFKLPATFVRVEAHQGTSSVFNPRTGRWLDQMNRPVTEQLDFMVPLELLPCRLKRAELAVKLKAPSRTLEILGFVDGQYVSLYRKANPRGLLKIEIERADVLQLDASGGLRLAIAISDSQDQPELTAGDEEASEATLAKPFAPNQKTWQIDYVQINLEGTTL